MLLLRNGTNYHRSEFVSHLKPISPIKTVAIWHIAFWHKVRDIIGRNTPCHRINAFVKQNAQRGDVPAILQAVDTYCRDKEWIMHLGQQKAERFSEIVQDCKPKVCLELGTYCGYSAILLGSMLPDDGKIYTVEFDKDFVRAAQELVEYAGMQEKITILQGDAGEVIPTLREKHSVDKFDFVFIDHHKPLYCRELKHIEAGKYVRRGTVVVGDDLGWPGSPEYDAYIQKSPSYQNTFYDTKIDMLGISDVMAKSIYLG
ncbi:Catechol O-methyltransferase [Apostichopus japonicus]|uniref:catechol O-methyltransferase n=1 Tax=Stichopus japonicus TaxID=307972 RepID=A0A2G8JSL6_STIJA|nr:Catechol O-methyltransferase [Apostichopus japonicus]